MTKELEIKLLSENATIPIKQTWLLTYLMDMKHK